MSFAAINPAPFWEDLKNYTTTAFRRDLTAALSVALLALPQAVAYAFVAGLPTSAGIWAAVFGTIFTAAFGQSRYLVSGPTNAVAILIQSKTSEIIDTYYRNVMGDERDLLALSIVMQIVLLVGIFQILSGLLRLGRLTQFASRSVLLGYMAGVALAILVIQLFPFFGIRELDNYYPVYQQVWYFFVHFFQLHVPTTLIAIGCLLLLIFLTRLSDKIPAAAIVFFLAASVVALLNLAPQEEKGTFDVLQGEKIERVVLLDDIGPLYSDLPKFSYPFFQLRVIPLIMPLAFAIMLLSVIEATAIGRAYNRSKDPPYNDNQEIFGLGMSNFLSAFLNAMPSSGSFSRSGLNRTTGAKTRFAAIFSGCLVFIFVVLLGFLLTQVPLAALSALMVFTAATMINYRDLAICMKTTQADAFVLLATFASSLIFTLDVALYIGIALSIVLYLKRSAVPDLVEYGFNNVGKLRPLEPDDERPDPRICITQVEGELFFGAADLLQTKLRNLAEDENIKVIILQLLNTRHMDASICMALYKVVGYLKLTHRQLLLSGVSPEVRQILHESGLLKEIGEENCFMLNERVPSESTRKAYALAKNMV